MHLSGWGVPESSIGIACPHCYHILPDEFFELPIIYIGLYGGSSSGKTTAVAFLLKEIQEADGVLQIGKIGLEWLLGHDLSYFHYKEIVENIRKHMLPAATSTGMKVPPVWLSLTVKIGTKNKRAALVAVRDIAGEATTSSTTVSLPETYLRNSQGVICLEGADSLFNIQAPNTDTDIPPTLLSVQKVVEIQKNDTSLDSNAMYYDDFATIGGLSNGSGAVRNSVPLELGNLISEIEAKRSRLRSVAMAVSKADLIPDPETLADIRVYASTANQDILLSDSFYHVSNSIKGELNKKDIDDLQHLSNLARPAKSATDLSFHLVSVVPRKVFNLPKDIWMSQVYRRPLSDNQIDSIVEREKEKKADQEQKEAQKQKEAQAQKTGQAQKAEDEPAQAQSGQVADGVADKNTWGFFYGFDDAGKKRMGLERPLAWIILNHWQRTHQGKMPWE